MAIKTSSSGLAAGAAICIGALLMPLAELHAQEKTMTVNGFDMHYVDRGQGKPIVFVHGAAGDPRGLALQCAAAARQHRCILPTLRYHGPYPWPDNGERYTTAQHTEDLAEFIRKLGAGPVHLVGWSYGGALSLQLAARFPELVKSVSDFEGVTLDGSMTPDETAAVAQDQRAFVTPVLDALKSNADALTVGTALYDGVGSVGRTTAMPPEFRQMLLDNVRTINLLFKRPPAPKLSCATFADGKTPIAFIRGDYSRVMFTTPADAAHRCLPKSKLYVLKDADHFGPAVKLDDFMKIVTEFVGTVSAQ
jgi:pimeloyl-ACP methyl ester carboxylesterase